MEKWRENYDNWKTRGPDPHYCLRCECRHADGLICDVCEEELEAGGKTVIENLLGKLEERYVCTKCGKPVDPDDWCSVHGTCPDCCDCYE
jgi:hypothetical protein